MKNKLQKLKNKLLSDHLMKSLIKKASGTFGVTLVGMGFSYIFAILLTRKYGADIFGLYSLAFVMLNIASMFSRVGIDTAAVKLIPSYRKTAQLDAVLPFYLKGLFTVFLLSSLTCSLVYFNADAISTHLFKKPDLAIYLRVFALVNIPFSLVQFNAETLRGSGFPAYQSVFKTAMIPTFGIMYFGIMFFTKGLDLAIYQLFLWIISSVCFLSFILVIRVLRKIHQDQTSFDLSRVANSDIFTLSLPMFLFSSTLFMSEWINTIMLGMYGTASEVGIYKVIVRISSLNTIVLTAVNTVIAPRIAGHFAKNDLSGLKDEVKRATNLIFWASLPVQIGLFVFATFFLGMFGKEFIAGLLPLYILLLAELINAFSGPVGQVMNMTNGQMQLTKTTILRVVFTIVFNVLFLPTWGLLGIALSLLLVKTFTNLINIYQVKKTHGFYTFALIKS